MGSVTKGLVDSQREPLRLGKSSLNIGQDKTMLLYSEWSASGIALRVPVCPLFYYSLLHHAQSSTVLSYLSVVPTVFESISLKPWIRAEYLRIQAMPLGCQTPALLLTGVGYHWIVGFTPPNLRFHIPEMGLSYAYLLLRTTVWIYEHA